MGLRYLVREAGVTADRELTQIAHERLIERAEEARTEAIGDYLADHRDAINGANRMDLWGRKPYATWASVNDDPPNGWEP